MKALCYISGLALLTLGSCSSNLYVGSEYDDLYYLSSDEPVRIVHQRTADRIQEGNLQSNYYDNIYATDTWLLKNTGGRYDDAVYNTDRSESMTITMVTHMRAA